MTRHRELGEESFIDRSYSLCQVHRVREGECAGEGELGPVKVSRLSHRSVGVLGEDAARGILKTVLN